MVSLDICQIIKIFTHHLGNQHNSRKIFRFIFSYKFSVSKDCDPVTDCIYLFQEMCDKNNSYAFTAEPTHQHKQFLNFFIIQRGSRLIQNQYFTFHINSTRNRDHLLNCHRAFIQHLCRRNIDIQTFQKLCRTCIHFLPADHSRLITRFTSNKQIFRNGQVRTEVYLLIYGTDTVCLSLLRRVIDDIFIFTIHMNGTTFEFMYTGQNFDQC